MRSELLIDALDYLDEDMLEAAAAVRMQPRKKLTAKKKNLKRICLICAPVAAACFCLLIVTSFSANLFRYGSADSSKQNMAAENIPMSSAASDSLTSGKNSAEGIADIAYTASFDAVILDVYENAVLVEPVEGSTERLSSDKIMVSTNVSDSESLPELAVGKTIRIVYDGQIAETYPAQIDTVYAIYDALEADDAD